MQLSDMQLSDTQLSDSMQLWAQEGMSTKPTHMEQQRSSLLVARGAAEVSQACN